MPPIIIHGMEYVLEHARRFRFPEKKWWAARTIPGHVPQYCIERRPKDVAKYGTTFAPILKRMLREIVDHFDPLEIWLFGSMARGDGGKNSDVDLLVMMPNGTTWRKSIDMFVVLDGSLLPSDIVVSTPEKWSRRIDDVGSLIHAVNEDGVMLYG